MIFHPIKASPCYQFRFVLSFFFLTSRNTRKDNFLVEYLPRNSTYFREGQYLTGNRSRPMFRRRLTVVSDRRRSIQRGGEGEDTTRKVRIKQLALNCNFSALISPAGVLELRNMRRIFRNALSRPGSREILSRGRRRAKRERGLLGYFNENQRVSSG